MTPDTEAYKFAEEDHLDSQVGHPVLPPWKVIVVDDDQDLQHITRIVLKNFSYEGRGVTILPALSGEEAIHIMTQHPDAAIMLLDVVMETKDAGLRVAKQIRKDLKNPLIRIILRTGQPGEAPETQVMHEYDINDYKEKTDLTAQKLTMTVLAGLRSYRDLLALDQAKTKLEAILRATHHLNHLSTLPSFVKEALFSIKGILPAHTGGVFVLNRPLEGGSPRIIGVTGDCSSWEGQTTSQVLPESLETEILRHMGLRSIDTHGDDWIIGIGQTQRSAGVIICKGITKEHPIDRMILEVFFKNFATIYENLHLRLSLEQKVQERTQALEQTCGELEVAAVFANKAKTNFLASISHELRTPLNSIIGIGQTQRSALSSNKDEISSSNSERSTAPMSTDIFPASIFDTSKSSLIRLERCSPHWWMMCASLFREALAVASRERRLEKPMIEFSGVRSS